MHAVLTKMALVVVGHLDFQDGGDARNGRPFFNFFFHRVTMVGGFGRPAGTMLKECLFFDIVF